MIGLTLTLSNNNQFYMLNFSYFCAYFLIFSSTFSLPIVIVNNWHRIQIGYCKDKHLNMKRTARYTHVLHVLRLNWNWQCLTVFTQTALLLALYFLFRHLWLFDFQPLFTNNCWSSEIFKFWHKLRIIREFHIRGKSWIMDENLLKNNLGNAI